MKNEISNLASSMKTEITVNQKIQNSTIKLQSHPHYAKALFRAFLLTITEFSLEEFKDAALFLRLVVRISLSRKRSFSTGGIWKRRLFVLVWIRKNILKTRPSRYSCGFPTQGFPSNTN